MKRPDYWKDLTPRRQLNDAVHKIAQRTGCTYAQAWTALERRFGELYGVNIRRERRQYEARCGALPTIPFYFQMIGRLEDAIEAALDMVKQSETGN